MRRVWVIEMLCDGQWEPCADARLTRSEAKRFAVWWRKKDPDDRFRTAKYVREEPKARGRLVRPRKAK